MAMELTQTQQLQLAMAHSMNEQMTLFVWVFVGTAFGWGVCTFVLKIVARTFSVLKFGLKFAAKSFLGLLRGGQGNGHGAGWYWCEPSANGNGWYYWTFQTGWVRMSEW